MNRDRGNVKWQPAMMLPEFVQLLNEAKEDCEKIEKPVLDEQQIEENEQNILAAMEYSFFSEFKFFQNQAIHHIKGYVHFVDYYHKYYRILDEQYAEHIVHFDNLLMVNNLDEIIPLKD